MANRTLRFYYRLSWRQHILLRGLTSMILLSLPDVYAREYVFDPTALEGDAQLHQDVDLSLFSNTKAQLPGVYHSIVMINEHKYDEMDLHYVNQEDGALVAQLTPAMLEKWGVRVDAYPKLAALPANSPLPQPLGNYIPLAVSTFDFTNLTLNISMPQAAIVHRSKGEVDPSRWDDGVSVLFTDYSFSGSQNEGSSDKSTNQYLNLRNGMNLGGWRLRNNSTYSKSEEEQSWNALQTFLQHDIKKLDAQFTAGESSTRGEVFDSLEYTGVNVVSDDEMLPTSQRGFAPTIRGVANSNAEVSVRQNGNLIYQATVAPGAFEINDIYSTSNSGDLDITIKEADGTEHHFTQPYSTVPLMQRPGRIRYEVTAAHYRASGNSDENEPAFGQASAIYGLNNWVTLFGGLMGSENYWATVTGLGIALGEMGSASVDMTYSSTTLDNDKESSGQSWRVLYSKNIEATDTHFTLASYRYSTSGYYDFADANRKYDDQSDENDLSFYYNKRNKLQLNISQNVLGSSVYLNGYQQDYWGTGRKDRNLSAGFNTNISGMSVYTAYTYSKMGSGQDDRVLSLGISVPLSRWLSNSWANYSLSNSKRGDTTQNLGVNGTLLDDQRLSYSLQQSHTNHGGTDDSSIYSSYRSQYAIVNAGYYYSSDRSRQLSYGASGALVAHPHGVTLSQPLGDSFAIINANGAKGVRFQNQRGIQTDLFGNAIIPSLTAYQENRIGIDTTTLPDDVDTSDTALTLVPTRNAAVNAYFDAHIGYRAMITLIRDNHNVVPFGALVSADDLPISGIVAENGVVYLAGTADNMPITVSWGKEPDKQCHAIITIPESQVQSDNSAGVRYLQAQCHQEKNDAVKTQ